MKTALPVNGGYWLDTVDGVLLGRYDGPEGKTLGVFDLCRRGGGTVRVDLPDGTYPNRLGGIVTVQNGQLVFDGTPVVI